MLLMLAPLLQGTRRFGGFFNSLIRFKLQRLSAVGFVR